jgi:hypothetical protein
MMKLFNLTIIVILSFVVCHAQNSKPETLTNKMVVSLVKAKFSADTIIKKIQTAASVSFDTGTDALIELKNSGVEEKIITAILDRGATNTPVKPSGIDGASGASTSVNVPTSQEKEKPKKFSTKVKYFTFDLSECKGVGDTIKCDLRVTNNDKDRERELVYPYGSIPTMIDDTGNRIKAYTKTIAGSAGGREMLTEGVPVSVSVTFGGLKTIPTTIKLLSIPFNTTPVPTGRIGGVFKGDYFAVEFRDVPVTQ